ncbi:MAG: Asp23/Gls24 family envelope stress response protein [Chloroflexota bacterium]
MNVFNRIFVVLTLLALIGLAAVAMVAPRAGIDSLLMWLNYLDEASFGSIGRVLVSLLVIAAAFWLLFLEGRRAPRSRVVVGQLDGAIAELSVEAIAQRLRREIQALPDVRSANPLVNPRRGGVDVRLAVITSPDVDVPAKAAEVGRVARDSLEQRMGLRVGKLWVNISHEKGSDTSLASSR